MTTVQDFANSFLTLVGDTTDSTPETFIIDGINWCFRELPLMPKLEKLFSRHYNFTLDANGHYKWLLNADFRKVNELPMINFYTSTGGEPCKLRLCYKPVEDFYTINGMVELKKPGTPCQYTLEEEGDNLYLVLDRPSDVPIIVDYIAYGYPQPVSSMDDELNLSALAEHAMFSLMRVVWTQEMDDWNVSDSLYSYFDNKIAPEIIQQLHKRYKGTSPIILGEA